MMRSDVENKLNIKHAVKRLHNTHNSVREKKIMDVNAEDIENDGSISKVGQSTQNYRKLF